MKKQWAVLIIIALLAVFAVYQNSSANEEQLPKVGYKVPQISLQALDGKTYSLQDLKGKPVVINFWASWCGPCKIEAPELEKMYGTYKQKVEIYAVNLTDSDSIQGARAFSEAYGFTFPVLLDERGDVAKRFQVQTIPTTYFVSSEGIIVDKVIGLVSPDTMENKFKQLIR